MLCNQQWVLVNQAENNQDHCNQIEGLIMSYLKCKVDALEKQVLFYKKLNFLFLFFLGAIMLFTGMGDAPDKITAKSLKIVNDQGKEIFYVGSSTNNDGLLVLTNRFGKEIVYLGANPNGIGLLKIKDEKGRDLSLMGTDPKTSKSTLSLFNSQNSEGVSLGINVSDGGVMKVNSSRGIPIVLAHADKDNDGSIEVYTRSGIETTRIGVAAKPTNSGILEVKKNGHVVAQVVASQEGGVLQIVSSKWKDEFGTPKVGTFLFDQNGVPRYLGN